MDEEVPFRRKIAECEQHLKLREISSSSAQCIKVQDASIYLPTPVDFKTLPLDLRNFLALEQHHRLLLLLWKKNAARKF